MNLLENIDFGNEAGDDVSNEEIEDIFYEQGMFQKYLNFNKRLLIFTGKKGIGKSILLKWMNLKFKEKDNDAIVIHCRGADLTRNQLKYLQYLKIRMSTSMIGKLDYVQLLIES